MHRTISGATRKTKIVEKKEIQEILNKTRDEANNVQLNECIYQNKKIISSAALNFLNLDSGDNLDGQLKCLIREAYDQCEEIYPYLGDLFLIYFFNKQQKKRYKTFRFSKKYQKKFLNTIKSNEIQEIASWFFENCSLDRNVIVEQSDISEIILKKTNNINFDIEFDSDFLGSSLSHSAENYRYIVIDGYIESVGEIHHLLTSAANTKEPYVIFCFGMSEEVKHTIINNNNRSITEIIPIVISFDASTANILNDIAVVHDCDVVSALKGQTISQEVRKKLPVGNKIKLFKNKVIVTPVCSKEKIDSHRQYLREKLNTDKFRPDIDTSCTMQRIKNFNLKVLTIYLPEKILKNITQTQSLDYFLRFLTNIEKPMTCIDGIFIPFECLEIVQKKINSTDNMYNNINHAVLFTRRSE